MEVAVIKFKDSMTLKEGKSEKMIFLDEDGTLDSKATVAFINALMKSISDVQVVFASSNRSSMTYEQTLEMLSNNKNRGLYTITDENFIGGTPTYFDFGEDESFSGFGEAIMSSHISDEEAKDNPDDKKREYEVRAAAMQRGCENYICFDDRKDLYVEDDKVIAPVDIENEDTFREAVSKMFIYLCGENESGYDIEIDEFVKLYKIEKQFLENLSSNKTLE